MLQKALVGENMKTFFKNDASRLLLLLIASLLIAFLGQGCLPREQRGDIEPSGWEAAPMHAWDEAFQTADPRWKGADSSSSVPLSGADTLWLFGDTWITDSEAVGRDQGKIVRNSLAVQQIGGTGPGAICFFWQQKKGRPEAAFLPTHGPGWLWPLSGIRLGNTLFLFYLRIVESKNDLGFELNGSVVLTIRNPDDPPYAWAPEQHDVPFFHHQDTGDLFFGLACLCSKGYVYVYGAKEDWTQGPGGRSLLVARARLHAFENMAFSSWQFYSEKGWAGDVKTARTLFSGAATEMSVSYFPALNRFLAVYSHCGLSREVLGRAASEPQGPWGQDSVLWRCPEALRNRDYFCYAGKAHPELACAANELVVTYAANSRNPEDHYHDLDLYWPRFVKITLDRP